MGEGDPPCENLKRIGGGIDPHASWISIGLGLPVVWLQIRMKRMLETSVAGRGFDEHAYERERHTWFLLGWPAFLALIAVFWLMVSKPTW